MSEYQEGIVVRSLTGKEEVETDRFMADVAKLAKEQGLMENDIKLEEEEEPFVI